MEMIKMVPCVLEFHFKVEKYCNFFLYKMREKNRTKCNARKQKTRTETHNRTFLCIKQTHFVQIALIVLVFILFF